MSNETAWRRRDFIGALLAVAAPAALGAAEPTPELWLPLRSPAFPSLPETLAGMTLQQLRDDYHDRLFRQYLPFWDRGGDDQRLGGFMCELNDDGLVFSDEKYIWYQGRAVWVYSFLYREFGREPRWLDVARRARDFMVRFMYAQDGRWYEKVQRDGTLQEGVGTTVYGWLFAAFGLAEYYGAGGREEDLDLAQKSILAALRAYDEPSYRDTHTSRYTIVDVPVGARSQGHSMLLLAVLSRLLTHHDNPRLAGVLDEHLDLIMNKFWNPAYGIVNEYLQHDYTRFPGGDVHMFAGHALETLWLVMHEALRRKDRSLFDTAKARVRRILEICWDDVFEGLGDGNFLAVDTPRRPRGPDFDIKTMWAHCEVLIACLTVLEYTAEVWAQEWYERVRAFTLRTMPCAAHGVWRQAVNRTGADLERVGVSTKRKDNFHQARYLMTNLLSLERMLENRGQCTPFPGLPGKIESPP